LYTTSIFAPGIGDPDGLRTTPEIEASRRGGSDGYSNKIIAAAIVRTHAIAKIRRVAFIWSHRF
jgi:hypothetical protein